jgi:hypothetical protein
MTSDKKTLLLRKYASLAKKLKRDPKMSDLKAVGVTKDMVTHHYDSLSSLNTAARAEKPKNFFDVSIDSIYSQDSLEGLRSEVSKNNRFVITTAVTGCKVHDGFYASLKNYCKINNATLLILTASDPASSVASTSFGMIDAKLQGETIVFEDTKLNSNVFLSTIKMSAKHIDPITGLSRIGQRNGTFVYASPKQRLQAVAVGNTKLPHFMMTTGAITEPNYKTERYMSDRTAYIANNDHVMGAIVVEIQDEEIFFFRQVQANRKGEFPDLGVMYSPNFSKSYAPSAFVLGDWHSGSTDPEARKCWEEVIQELLPDMVVLHDLFDGRGISHHEDKDIILKSQRANRDELSLDLELQGVARDLKDLSKLTNKLIVVKSNHDLFLERYLREGRYVKDPLNHRLSLMLALELIDGNDPLKSGVEAHLDKEIANKINWLNMDEDFKVANVQLGAHGHAGSNGAKGSLVAMEHAYGNSITGHTHTPSILRGAWQVGTSSYLKLSYVKGSSSWLHSSCLLYPNGSRQLINCINGNWRLK